MIAPRSRRAAVALAAAWLLATCSRGDDAGEVTVDRAQVADALYAEIIVPGYTAVAARADALVSELGAACASVPADGSALDDAREAWRQTQRQWSATRAYRFGPAQMLRAMSKIAYPIDAAKIEKLLAGTDPISGETVAGLGADQRGLGAIELVVFGDAVLDERRCALAVAASALVAEAAHSVVEAWLAAPPTDANEFVADSVNGMIFALADVADMRLGIAANGGDGDSVAVEVDRGVARAALDDIAAVLESVEAMRAGGADGGVGRLVAAISTEANERLAEQLGAASAAVAALPTPLAQARRADVLAAHEIVRAPLVTMRTEIASLLGVTLQLGDADGDS